MPRTTAKPADRKTSARNPGEPRLSRQRKPQDLPIDDWQRTLRHQYGREQAFELENLGDDPVFSEFSVYNPDSRRRYRVAIRGAQAGDNHCSCPDFATNDLGTCKHIEFALARIAAQADGQNALAGGFRGSFSELFLDYAGQRRVRLQLGSDFPFELQPTVGRLFDTVQGWQLSPEHFAGAQLLGEISAASSGERASSWGQTDPATGKCYLKLPVPDPQTIQRLAEGLLGLLGGRK